MRYLMCRPYFSKCSGEHAFRTPPPPYKKGRLHILGVTFLGVTPWNYTWVDYKISRNLSKL